jgi:hypothetical protein
MPPIFRKYRIAIMTVNISLRGWVRPSTRAGTQDNYPLGASFVSNGQRNATAEVRAEFFNFTNHLQFGPIGVQSGTGYSPGNSLFGAI